ncbi:PREDICTED: larval cuticle protein 8-like [Rhagoletis zephyria]|uniref:larval cuticle protein 8-like n=1 Tax=Rhagoletis zephyria TaxID=28612 RepID=UPI0008118E1E|nr:PREDICTED: larval cuticle protein 8-like [Rhagoletis zephyria]XP_036337364.1 larval cuticle protein 65Ag1-like [Rhagoletis pomonella]
MKFVIVFVALFALAIAAPAGPEVEVVEQRSDVEPEQYSFSLKTSDGTSKQEEGKLVNVGAEDEHIVARGSFSFVAADGQTYTVNYIADENGFQPQGDHLPVAPVA